MSTDEPQLHSDGRRPFARSMNLLQQLMDRPLDPSYAAASEARKAAGRPAATSTHTPLVLVAVVLIGFLLVVAARALHPVATSAAQEKQQLIDQIEARQAYGDQQAGQISALSAQIQQAQAAALASQASDLPAELQRLDVLTGAVAVSGSGVVLKVDDAPASKAQSASGDARDANGFPAGRVTSFDLQILTNGLWQSGAEAISVNGQRLTARSAIRFAGDAILVDYRPLSPPYVVTAIGDSRTMQTAFASSAAGAYLKSLGDNYAIPGTVTSSGSLDVPRSPSLRLSLAQPVPTGTPTSTPSVTTSTPSTPSTKGPTS